MKRPQFLIRDLLWMMALVAVGCGWWLDSSGAIGLRLQVRDLLTQRRQQHERESHLLESLIPHLEKHDLVLVHTVEGWELRDLNDKRGPER